MSKTFVYPLAWRVAEKKCFEMPIDKNKFV